MKTKQTNIFKLSILLLGISFLIFSCEKDELLEPLNQNLITNQNEFKISKIGKIEIQKNKNLKFKLRKLTESLLKNEVNNQNKTIASKENGFTINTDYAKFIESPDKAYHSYTFYIQRNIETTNLENLLISYQSDGTYKMKLVTYNTTKQEKSDLINGYKVDLSGKVSSKVINDEGLLADIFSKAFDCEGYIVTESCGCGVHDEESGYADCDSDCYEYDREYFGCGSTGGGSTGGGSTGGGSTGGGSTGGGSTGGGQTNNGGSGNTSSNDDVTSPTGPCVDCPDIEDFIDENPCSELTALEQDEYIKQQLNELTPIAENDNVNIEIGVFFKDNGTGWGATTVTGTAANPEISFSFNNNAAPIDIFVHTHYNGLLSTFSPGDLQAYHQFLSNNLSANGIDLVFILITNSGTKYAFKVNDLNKFNTIAQEHFTTTNDLNDFANTEFASINTSNDNDTNELEFLKMMKNVDMGISLFKANEDYSEWQNLSLNENEDQVIPDDCN